MQDDFLSGFMFGMLVTQSANNLDRERMSVMPNVRKCLEDIVTGEITLVDSPEEISPELGQVPDLLKPQADRMMRDALRAAREANKQSAAKVLAALNQAGV